jgi:magnesium-protoporphyrin O-methyltransferase
MHEATTYGATRARVEDYFDRTATRTWERLTSDAPVSRIRQTVREGRDRMRATMLSRLPEDLTGLRVLDAGCGPGVMTAELAARGATVTAADISPQLVEIAEKRLPEAHRAASPSTRATCCRTTSGPSTTSSRWTA